MNLHFATLFNLKFLPQGLNLYDSLKSHLKEFKLHVLALDQQTAKILEKLNRENIVVHRLEELENDSLIEAKSTRTFGEYCWTLTPFIFDFVFNSDETIEMVTYLDADLYFFSNPTNLLDEFYRSPCTALITPHYFNPIFDQVDSSGNYCVQFVSFKKSETEIRERWKTQCLKWCYNRHEDNKFGDQKYLDEWSTLYRNRILESQPNQFIAPWNALFQNNHKIVAYHFHGLRIINSNKVYLSSYLLPNSIIRRFYKPYIQNLKQNIRSIQALAINFDCRQERLNLRLWLKSKSSATYAIFKLLNHNNLSQ